MHCRHCNAERASDVSVCWNCGDLARRDPRLPDLECENHSNEQAVACCVICGKPVCGDCCTTHEGKFLCDQREHRSLLTDWTVVCTVSSEFEADMIRQNLFQAQFDSRVFSFGNHVTTIQREEFSHVRVMVKRSELSEASDLLRSLRLIENNTD